MAFQVYEINGGDEAHSFALPDVQVIHIRHRVEHLVAHHLRPNGNSLPPYLKKQQYKLIQFWGIIYTDINSEMIFFTEKFIALN